MVIKQLQLRAKNSYRVVFSFALLVNTRKKFIKILQTKRVNGNCRKLEHYCVLPEFISNAKSWILQNVCSDGQFARTPPKPKNCLLYNSSSLNNNLQQKSAGKYQIHYLYVKTQIERAHVGLTTLIVLRKVSGI